MRSLQTLALGLTLGLALIGPPAPAAPPPPARQRAEPTPPRSPPQVRQAPRLDTSRPLP